MIYKLKLHPQGFYWKKLRALHALEGLEPLFKIFYTLAVGKKKSRENYRQMYGNSSASLWRNLGTGTPPKFFRIILCFEALVYNWYFFRTAVLRKLFDIRYMGCMGILEFLLVESGIQLQESGIPVTIAIQTHLSQWKTGIRNIWRGFKNPRQ